jgi:O-antigen/teichoic acid export membrane protein
MVALLFAGILAGAPLVPLVFGQSFVESARVLPVLLLAVGFYCVFIAYIPILNVRERTGGMLAASAAAAATNVAGDLLLVPAWGILGAAWATVCAQCASGTVVAWLAHREHPFSFGPAVSFLSALVVVVIAWTLLDGWPAATAAAAAALLLALAGRRYRLGSPSDQRMLASLGVPALQRWLPVLAAERS